MQTSISARARSAGVKRALCLAASVALAACGSDTTGPSGNGSTLTATIDGTSFVSITTIGVRTPALPNLPNGTVGVSGSDKVTLPYTLLAFSVPCVIGTYPLASTGNPVPQNASVTNLISTTAGAAWNAGGTAGGTGVITLSTLTATSASGVFSFTLVPQSGTGATGNKVVTNGVFNVKF